MSNDKQADQVMLGMLRAKFGIPDGDLFTLTNLQNQENTEGWRKRVYGDPAATPPTVIHEVVHETETIIEPQIIMPSVEEIAAAVLDLQDARREARREARRRHREENTRRELEGLPSLEEEAEAVEAAKVAEREGLRIATANSVCQDVISALIHLGYRKEESVVAVSKCMVENREFDALFRASLQCLSE